MEADEQSAGSAWLRVENGLISGIGHALNNRAAAVSAVAQVLGIKHEGDPLAGTLSAEAEKLEATIGLLRLLVRGWGGAAEPVQLPEALEGVQNLMRQHSALRDLPIELEVEAGLLPVYAEPSALLHALCVMVGGAAMAAEAGGGGVRVRCFGDELVSAVEVTGVVGEDGTDAAAAAPLVRPFGGSVAVTTNGSEQTVRLELPTLPEVRRREREGR